MLRKMQCGETWCKWIKGSIELLTMSILVNGSDSKEFKTKRGVRQGDPLSPFLFNVVADGLNALF